mmetsp:Transcript_49636/g.107518  ORF Transcript_49636/g.107518 Transcript_49636/m.107518 type:complete len:207 (-) Transcript_49636:1334-1954(-)
MNTSASINSRTSTSTRMFSTKMSLTTTSITTTDIFSGHTSRHSAICQKSMRRLIVEKAALELDEAAAASEQLLTCRDAIGVGVGTMYPFGGTWPTCGCIDSPSRGICGLCVNCRSFELCTLRARPMKGARARATAAAPALDVALAPAAAAGPTKRTVVPAAAVGTALAAVAVAVAAAASTDAGSTRMRSAVAGSLSWNSCFGRFAV